MNKALMARALPATLLGLFSAQAGAAAFQLLEQSASGLGNAFAGSAAVAENASTVYFNPAGMTQLAGNNLSVGFNYITLKTQFHNGNSANPYGPYARNLSNDGGDAGDAAVVPNFYFTKEITPNWYIGFGAGGPFGLRTDYPSDFRGKYLALKSDIQAINLNPSIAYKANDRVSLGFGLNYQKFEAELSSAVNGSVYGDGKFKVNGDDWSWGWNAGALFTLSPQTKIGVSYRSAIQHEVKGNYNLSGLPTLVINQAGYPSTSGNAKVSIKLPETWILSATHQLNDRWELLGDVSMTGWSSVPELRIKFANGAPDKYSTYKWKDSWRVALGANYTLSERTKLKFGLAVDKTPLDGSTYRTPRLPDEDRLWLSLGLQYKLMPGHTIDVGYAYLSAKDAKIHDSGTPANAMQNGVLDGTYKSHVQILGVQYSMQF